MSSSIRLVGAALAAAVAMSCSSSNVVARKDKYFDDRIHSDLPLFQASDHAWPNGFPAITGDKSLTGCMLLEAPTDQWPAQPDPTKADIPRLVEWCFAEVRPTYGPSFYRTYSTSLTYLIKLGTLSDGREMWVIQTGFLPGSDLRLLTRKTDVDPAAFDVLQVECPADRVRDAGPAAVALTRYCAINSAEELGPLARSMAERPRLGVLRFEDLFAGASP